MSTARKILSNTAAQVLGKVIVALLGLSVVKIATTYLSVEGYGDYVLVYEFLAFFGIAADLGLFTIAVKEMSEDEKRIPKIIANILTLRAILITVTMLLAIGLAFAIPSYQDSKIPLGITIASITVFLTIINGTITSVLQTKLKMGKATIASVIGKVASVGFMFWVVFKGFPTDSDTGFFMLLSAGIIGALINLLITNYYVRQITPLKLEFDTKLWKEVLKKSLPYGIALILNTIYFRIDSILISFMRGSEEVGIYGVAMKMLENFAIIPLYFMNSVLPVLSKSIRESRSELKNDERTARVRSEVNNLAPPVESRSELKYKEIIKHSFNFLATLSIPMVVGGVILAYPIIFIVASPEFLSRLPEGFYGSDIAFQILIFALLFQFLSVLFAFVLISLDKQYKLLYINGGCVIFNLLANFFVIPYYGFRGAAVTSVLSELLILIATYVAAKRLLDFHISLKHLAKIILSAGVMGASVYYLQGITYKWVQNWNVLLLVLIGGFVYSVMLLLTQAIDKKTIKMLLKKD